MKVRTLRWFWKKKECEFLVTEKIRLQICILDPMPSCDLSDLEKVPQIRTFIVTIEMRFDSLLVYSTDLIGLSWLHNHNLVKLKYPMAMQ